MNASFIGKVRSLSSSKEDGQSVNGFPKFDQNVTISSSILANLSPNRRNLVHDMYEGANDLGQPTTSHCRIARSSGMVYSFSEAVYESAAMAYFIQFMEEIGQLNLIKFWLHVESFKVSASSVKRYDEATNQMIRNDAELILLKYIVDGSAHPIGITNDLREQVIESLRSNKVVDVHCFQRVQKFVRDIIEKKFFVEFQSGIYYAKYRLDIISDGAFSITDIIKCQSLLSAFVEYMEGEGERKLIEFIISVESFNNELATCPNDEQVVEDAMIIYSRYFSMQATEPLKFGTKIRIKIESDICTEEGRPETGCFDAARNLAINILEQSYLKRFTASAAFIKYIRNLMAEVDRMDSLDSDRKKKKRVDGSDQSSEMSSNEKASRRSITQSNSSLASRSNQLCNDEDDTASQPDNASVSSYGTCSSWKRRRSRLDVSLAMVDDMGRYKPLYDNSYSFSGDTGLSRRKIKNKIGKLLGQTVKKESDIADQVAQLIVADVHNMVSAGSTSKQ